MVEGPRAKNIRFLISRWAPLLLLLPAAYLLEPVFWAPLDNRFYNYFHSKRSVPPWTDVVVVAIDDATERQVFKNPIYPLSRHVDDHARVTENLDAAGVRAIVFDLRFTEDMFVAPPLRLAEAFRASGKVYLVMSLFETRQVGRSGGETRHLHAIMPHPSLLAASAGAYAADVQIDPDGVLRRFHPDPRFQRLGVSALAPRLAGIEVPKSVPVEFPSENRPIPMVSYRDVWEGKEDVRRLLVGRIAFVGSVQDESTDYVSVPRMQAYDGARRSFILPGVTALAAMTETLVRGAPVRDARWPVVLLWNILWCMTAVTVVPRKNPVRAALLFGAVFIASIVATGLLHVFAGYIFPAGLLVGCLVFAGGHALVSSHVASARALIFEEAENRRVHRELEAARRVQERFLPKDIPCRSGYDLAGENLSSREVSGDYYDVIDPGSGGPLILAVADVSGKGLPAALLMSNVQAALHCHVLQGNFDIRRTVRNINRLVCQNTEPEDFVTMFVAELEGQTRRLRYVCAGHDAPIIVSANGETRRLQQGGLILGHLPDFEYEVDEAVLELGDVLCLYTDGVTEAQNPLGEQFQVERLEQLLRQSRGKTAGEIVESIIERVRDFSRVEQQEDDVTIVVVKVE